MLFRKITLMTSAILLSAALTVFPSMAHGHHGHHGGSHHGGGGMVTNNAVPDSTPAAPAAEQNNTTVPPAAENGYPVCPVEGCPETGHHVHDNAYYCGYHHESGYCDGSCLTAAAPSAAEYRYSYPVCTMDGCTESGRHTHSGAYYCGYHHESGYCDGSCINIPSIPGRHGHCRVSKCHTYYD